MKALKKYISSPQAVFLYFIVNVLWVVATFFLQAIGNDIISIKIPKYIPGKNTTGEYLKVRRTNWAAAYF